MTQTRRIHLLTFFLITPVLIGVLLLAAFTASPAHTAASDTLTVSNLNDSGTGSLRQAISDASSGDTIAFSTSGTIVLTSELLITESLTIDGGDVITVSGNNATRVFNVMTSTQSPQVAVTFDSLNITNGNPQNPDCGQIAEYCGGGIMLQNSAVAVTVTGSTLSSNSANFGGSIFNESGTLTLNNSTIHSNSANFGGGIANYGTMVIDESTFTNNSAGNGGGIFTNGGPVMLTNSTLSNNLAAYGGGFLNATIATIRNTTLTNNSADAIGGGIMNSGMMTLTQSTLAGNTANYGAGMMNDGILTIQNSTISDNFARRGGGGIYSSAGTVLVNNSTISANLVDGGNEGAAGIGVYGDDSTFTTLTNTLVSGNIISGTMTSDDLRLVDDVLDSFISGGHNLIGAIGANITAFTNGVNGDQTGIEDPKLGLLTDNGGSTLTHALLVGSLALDTGAASCGLTDQRGVLRPQNGICDIGAYEKQFFYIFLPMILKAAN